jgi:hypothetical protein
MAANVSPNNAVVFAARNDALESAHESHSLRPEAATSVRQKQWSVQIYNLKSTIFNV